MRVERRARRWTIAPRRGAAALLVLVAVTYAFTGIAPAKDSRNEGRWLAFERASGGQTDIYVAVPGRNAVPIIGGSTIDAHPVWGPPPGCSQDNGEPIIPNTLELAFDRHTPGGDADIFVAQVSGLLGETPAVAAAPRNITNRAGADDTAPAWNAVAGPDGMIAFTSDRDANGDGRRDRDIFVMDRNGGNVVNITHDDADDANPDWASTATHVVFESTRSGEREIWAVPVSFAGGGVQAGAAFQITHGGGDKRDPSWITHFVTDLPEQHQIVYSVEQGGRRYLDLAEHEIVDIDVPPFGDPLAVLMRSLTGDPGDDTAPSWSPGANALVFATTDGGSTPRLAIMRGGEFDPLRRQGDPVVPPAGDGDTNPDWEALSNCANPHPRMPAPAPVNRTPKGSGGGDTGGGSGGGGGGSPPSEPGPAAPGPTAPQPAGPTAPGGQPPVATIRCTIRGNRRANVLRGTRRADVICGGGGADRIIAGRGNDIVDGGPGADRIDGGAGNDRLGGAGGGDRIVGGPGRDTIDGGAGRDDLRAKDGTADTVQGGAGRDSARIDRRLDRVRGVERRRS
jgi:Ca2+-binding RTX toxin-like protein